jgi:hypothetical protein
MHLRILRGLFDNLMDEFGQEYNFKVYIKHFIILYYTHFLLKNDNKKQHTRTHEHMHTDTHKKNQKRNMYTKSLFM